MMFQTAIPRWCPLLAGLLLSGTRTLPTTVAAAEDGVRNVLLLGNTVSRRDGGGASSLVATNTVLEDMLHGFLREAQPVDSSDARDPIWTRSLEYFRQNTLTYQNTNLTDYMTITEDQSSFLEQVLPTVLPNRDASLDWVTVQEQGEIPGFCPPDDNDSREEMYDISLQTILDLHHVLTTNQYTTKSKKPSLLLVQTWGYFEGTKDAPSDTYYSSDIYPNYDLMQRAVNRGYREYYDELVAQDHTAVIKVAPCGDAFRRVYDQSKQNRLQPSSLFDRLYEPQDAHGGSLPRQNPSVLGNYLCAAVMAQTMWGVGDVRRSTFRPVNSNNVPMDVADVKELLNVAYQTVQAFGDGQGHPTKHSKSYTPHSQARVSQGTHLLRFFVVFLVGFGVVAGFMLHKWKDASAALHDMELSGNYTLLPTSADGGGDDGSGTAAKLMELMTMEAVDERTPPEPQWINPV